MNLRFEKIKKVEIPQKSSFEDILLLHHFLFLVIFAHLLKLISDFHFSRGYYLCSSNKYCEFVDIEYEKYVFTHTMPSFE